MLEIFTTIFYVIFFYAFWYILIKYRKQIHGWTGNFVWAEKYLWSWGTYFVLLLLGLGCIFYGTIYPFWWMDLFFWKTSIPSL
jgi:hypothetical protein